MNRCVLSGWLCALALAGCAGQAGSSAARSEQVAHEQVQGPHVPSGTRFMVRLNQQLDLSTNAPGQAFEGVVTEALRTARGDTLVPSGALVHGTVVFGGHSGRVLLRNATVDTAVGPVELRGAVRPGLAGETDALASESDTTADPREASPSHPAPARSAQAPEGHAGTNPFVLARGAAVEVVLTRALLAPGTSVITTQ